MTTKIPIELSSTPGIVDNSNTTALTLDASQNAIFAGTVTGSRKLVLNASGTNDTHIEIGANTASNHYAFIDLVGDATYTDYGLRIIRNNGGANTSSFIYHRGTGNFNIETQDSASLKLRTAGADALTIDTSQRVGIGTTSPNQLLHLDNSASSSDSASIRIISGTAGLARIMLGDTGYGSRGRFVYDNSDDSLQLWGADGTTSAERMRINSAGNVGMGPSNPLSRLHISGNSDSGDAECTLTIDDEDTTSGSMVPAIQFRGNGNNLARIRANDQQGLLISGSSGNEDDIVVQEGKVGMGTNSPAIAKGLHINSAGNSELRLTTTQDSGTPTAQIGYGAGSGYFLRLADAANNEDVMLRTYGKSVFNGGGVVIGTTSANAPFDNSMLHVTQSTSHADPVLALDSNNGDQSYYRYIRFYKKTSNQVGRLDADISGSSMGLHYESDGRYKEVLGVADGMNLIEKLNPIKFKWLDGTGEGSQGFKAQEYKQAFNDVGSYARGVIEPEDESTEKWMLDYTHLMPNVIKALQELSAKNDALEARIQELEG